jgi:hypothetical protein
VAGATLLLYIATGIADMVVSAQATVGADTAAKLASIAQHVPQMRIAILLTILQIVYAVALGVTLHALTRDEDRDVAMLGLAFRIGEGVVASLPVALKLALFALATSAAADVAATRTSATVLLSLRGTTVALGATLFALGSLCFSSLFVRARSIPAWLAWLGLASSALLVVTLPLGAVGLFGGPLRLMQWLPMLVFEVVLAGWLIVRGVAPARPPISSPT